MTAAFIREHIVELGVLLCRQNPIKKESFAMIGKIISNRNLTRSLYEMIIEAPDAANAAKMGQFIHIYCGKEFTLRRPISICDASKGTLKICYDMRGKGTAAMAQMKVGDTVDIMGPLGNGFSFDEGAKVLMVGGGIGIYPLIMAAKRAGRGSAALLGFRSAKFINYTNEFERAGVSVKIVTDDGSAGVGGFVTDLIDGALKAEKYDLVICCGPAVMMKKAAAIAAENGVSCQVSLEERMACGLGACAGCACAVRTADGGMTYKKVCKDGPVFDSAEVIWE